MKEINIDAKSPLVTIVVPVYNGQNFLSQCLDSLIKQTISDRIEIIVIDDGSTDRTRDVVNHFSFFRGLSYYHKENGGTGSALNYGHDKARGRYITWCAHDNIYFPAFAEALSSILVQADVQGHNVQLVYSDFVFMDANGKVLREIKHEKPQAGIDLVNGYDVGMSFMYTKELWNKTGPYWNRICEDFDFAVRAAQHTSFALIKTPLAAFRIHGGQITGSNKEEEKSAANDCKALAKKLFATPKPVEIKA